MSVVFACWKMRRKRWDRNTTGGSAARSASLPACRSTATDDYIERRGAGDAARRKEAKGQSFSTQAQDKAPHYQHSHIGYNYRMSNICAYRAGQMYVLEGSYCARRHIDIAMDLNYITKDKLERLKPVILKFQTS